MAINESYNIAICVVAYDRLEAIACLLQSLQVAHYSEKVDLIISVDKSYTSAVEDYADNYQWEYGEKYVVKHKENLGLRRHILSVGEYTQKYDAIVVLEDDLIVGPNFYNYTLATVDRKSVV